MAATTTLNHCHKFFHNYLLQAKENRLAEVVLGSIAVEKADIHCRLNDELSIVIIESRDVLQARVYACA